MYKLSAPKLKQLRKEAEKTQADIALIMGKNKKDVSHYENKRATPPADSLITLMIELKINPLDIAEKV